VSGASLVRRSRPHAGPANRPLTPPVAPRVHLLPGFFGAPGSILPPSRQRERLVRSEAPSIDKCSLTRFRGGSPPPYPELCRSRPASGALSLLDMLSHEGARPSTVVTGYSPVVARTARCLPTSAIVTNCEHNRYRSVEPRTPRRSRLLRSFFLRVAWLLSERSQPRVHGSGAIEVSLAASSHRDRSRGKLNPNPIGSDTSCRNPVSAGGWRSLRRRCALLLRDIHRLAGLGHALAKPGRVGPPHTPPREGNRNPLRPRCLPSTSPPSKGCAHAPPVHLLKKSAEEQ
jgi:hypothetical protein